MDSGIGPGQSFARGAIQGQAEERVDRAGRSEVWRAVAEPAKDSRGATRAARLMGTIPLASRRSHWRGGYRFRVQLGLAGRLEEANRSPAIVIGDHRAPGGVARRR